MGKTESLVSCICSVGKDDSSDVMTFADEFGIFPNFREVAGAQTGTCYRIVHDKKSTIIVDLAANAKNSDAAEMKQSLDNLTNAKIIQMASYANLQCMKQMTHFAAKANELKKPFGLKFDTESFELCSKEMNIALMAA